MQTETVLRQNLDETTKQIRRLENGLSEKPKHGMGRGDALIARWEFNQALLTRLKRSAARMRVALSRIEQGTYGVCERCGGTIHPDRVAVLPGTRLCIQCARLSTPGAR